MDFYIDEKDKELGPARLSQGGEGAIHSHLKNDESRHPKIFQKEDVSSRERMCLPERECAFWRENVSSRESVSSEAGMFLAVRE